MNSVAPSALAKNRREMAPIGRDVRVIRCEALKHGDNPGCVCHLIGGVERIASLYETPFAGTPSYHLFGRSQRVRLSEVNLIDRIDDPPANISATYERWRCLVLQDRPTGALTTFEAFAAGYALGHKNNP